MFLTMFKSKIHRATVTEANLNYMSSITIDQDLLEAANLFPHEKVRVVNNNKIMEVRWGEVAAEIG